MLVRIGEPTRHARPQFVSSLKSVEIDAFVLHRPPQAFDEDVVHPAGPAVHAGPHSRLAQYGDEGGAGELTALIRIEDLRLAVAGYGVLQSFDAKSSIHRVRDALGQHLARGPVHDRHQVEEAAQGRYVSSAHQT